MKEYISNSEEDTFEIASEIANSLSFPAVILLDGDLGAGKTHFVKGFVKALGDDELVTSPTFTIMNEYTDGKVNVYHFDMYRLSSMEEAINLGFEEYFDLKTLNGVSLVEWPQNVEGLFPKEVIQIYIEKIGINKRKIIIKWKTYLLSLLPQRRHIFA